MFKNAEATHPAINAVKPVALMSGENPKFKGQATGNKALKQELDQLGFPYDDALGRYGAHEPSLIIYGIPKEQAVALGKKYGQESVIHGENGHHQMVYTNGPDEGLAHEGLGTHDAWPKDEPPEDYWTRLPDGSYFRLHFKWDQKAPANGGGPQQPTESLQRKEKKYSLLQKLSKSATLQRNRWPGSYEWHDGSTQHYGAGLQKDETKPLPHPHTAVQPKLVNEQAAPKGVATYAEFAKPFGHIDEAARQGGGSNLFHYDYHGKNEAVNQLVAKHGYTPYYAGGSYGKPDLASKNYNTGHLMIYSPEPDSGASFKDRDYTDSWRKVHELAHALTYKDLNSIYGEGRRIGKLGVHRTQNEAERAVHWEWLAAHKQRELNAQLGIHVPDETFHKELNTVMHDAAHRAVTGQFTEPSEEGFVPHSHKIPLETSLNLVRNHVRKLGLQDRHSLLQRKMGKNEDNLLARRGIQVNDKTLSSQEFLAGLSSGLKQVQADIETMQKAEAKKAALSEGGGGDMAAPPLVASEKKVEKNLGDGGIADPSTEKGYMKKGALCKACGEKSELCKCGELTKFALSKTSMPAGASPTYPNPDPDKKINTKGKVIESEGSGGQIVKKAEAGGIPGPTAAPKAPKAPKPPGPSTKPPAVGSGTPMPNLKAEKKMEKGWKGPFGSAPPGQKVQTMAERVASKMPMSADSMVGESLPASGTVLTGGALSPVSKPAPKVQTMAERVASKMPAPSVPAPAAHPSPLFGKTPAAAAPPPADPKGFAAALPKK